MLFCSSYNADFEIHHYRGIDEYAVKIFPTCLQKLFPLFTHVILSQRDNSTEYLSTVQPLYNSFHFNTYLDLTQSYCGSQIYFYTGLDINKFFQRIIVKIFLPINFNICFGCTKEPSHWDGSFEYPQLMFWLRNKEVSFSLHTLN